MSLEKPEILTDDYRFYSFFDGEVLLNKKKNHLPCMGWNSWNAFGSGNTQDLTKAMADKIVELGLDKLGYKYIVLDDGCYKAERINGKLSNDTVKFADGFRSLSDYIHSKGLKFGMYNDIGTNLCAGAAVGTCGHEIEDAQSYIDWGVDFLKIDNCYYPWDNATFSNPENAKYVYAPAIKGMYLTIDNETKYFDAVKDGVISGKGLIKEENCVKGIGTLDGTNTGVSPDGPLYGELEFNLKTEKEVEAELVVEYATDKVIGQGQWLQVIIKESAYFVNCAFDDLLLETPTSNTFVKSQSIKIKLVKGFNVIVFANHRRQENTLCSYAAMLDGLNKANSNHDVILSICEWGKTQPHKWGYKVGDSWRILNDITFRVGSDGDAGYGSWYDKGTCSITSQYNKAVIMSSYAGLENGWNDPDMLMIGMKGLTLDMCKTHFSLWCMMNSPLMLGLDLRNVTKGDDIYNIISNEELIKLNQDPAGIQARRIYTTIKDVSPISYIEDIDRADILMKSLKDGSYAFCFVNLSETHTYDNVSISLEGILEECNWSRRCELEKYTKFRIVDLWTKEEEVINTANGEVFNSGKLLPCQCKVIRAYGF